MTLQELLASSLERLGANGLASKTAKTTDDDLFRSIEYIRQALSDHQYYAIHARCIVVWASADGTLFPSAEERDAHDGVKPVETNEEHFKCSCAAHSQNTSATAKRRECRAIDCTQCRLNHGPANCNDDWDKAPYGMPLDKRIPWPNQP